MAQIVWRGTILIMMLLSLSGCAGGPAVTQPTQPAASTVAFIFPTPTTQPTPTELPDGPFTWAGGQRPLLMAHYMPWYQTQAHSGSWGWHWTMGHFSPKQSADGTWSELASHDTPLIGPYDSQDEAVLEYQVLLMKLSGIDGVVIDWYGMENFRDYGQINESTARLVQAVKKAGLKFVICYEDQTVKHRVDNQHLPKEDAVEHGKAVMRYLQKTWFGDEAYLKVDGRPLLLTFGPQYFKGDEWETLFSVLKPQPVFITLDKHEVPGSAGSYPWPPIWAAPGQTLAHERLASYLSDFYTRAAGWEYQVGGAFPGYHDIYKEAGAGDSNGYLDALDGKTLRYTLQTALDHQPDLVQLITWNDYGEGTVLEPTVANEYRYLEMIQEARQVMGGTDFVYDRQDLRLPLAWYHLRVKYAEDTQVSAQLEHAFAAMVAGNVAEAEKIVNSQP